ncbi:MAG: CRTAC1 family protein [Planctomycetes bacterium]|nr:CRTAC1 family protein [Planctomycetota bacterium]
MLARGRRLVIILMAGLWSCHDRDAQPAQVESRPGLFREVTIAEGAPDFHSSMVYSGTHALPEIMGSGLAVFDADGDGDLDIYALDAGPGPAPNRLYLQDDRGRFRAAEQSGLEDPGHATGVAVGDVDGDDDLDVFVGNLGQDRLYLNDGRGVFHAAPGLPHEDSWTTSVGMLDVDRDGDLDLFLVRYLVPEPVVACQLGDQAADFCAPDRYRPLSDILLVNRGDGRFEERSREAGLTAQSGHGLGLCIADFDLDGILDVYVANDADPNQLWLGDGEGRFREAAFERGCAVNGEGRSEAGMGVDVSDLNADGHWDLFLSHLVHESDTLYLSDGAGGFRDATGTAGLYASSLAATGFGLSLSDLDGDGHADIAVANGRVSRGSRVAGAVPHPPWDRYAEADRLLLGDGQGRFAPTDGGDWGRRAEVSRALAAVDIDDDGDLDLVTTQVAGPMRLFINRSEPHFWLRVSCRKRPEGTEVPNTCVEICAGVRRWRLVQAGAQGYLTAVVAPLVFGLGREDRVDDVIVTWPDGQVESFGPAAAGARLVLVKGAGR